MGEERIKRGLIDIHDTRALNKPGGKVLHIEHPLSSDQLGLISSTARNFDSTPESFEVDLEQALLPEVRATVYSPVGNQEILLKSVITADMIDKWSPPRLPHHLRLLTDSYYRSMIARYSRSPHLTRVLELTANKGMLFTYWSNAPVSKWPLYWHRLLKPDRPFLDPRLVAMARPDAIEPGAFFKGVSGAIRSRYEDIIIFDNDPAQAAPLRPFCRGFYFTVRREDIKSLPPLQRSALELLLREEGDKVVLQSDDPDIDAKKILSL